MMVTLTDSEASSLLGFLELNLLDDIKDDPDLDSLPWLCNMVHILEKCIANEECLKIARAVSDEGGDADAVQPSSSPKDSSRVPAFA